MEFSPIEKNGFNAYAGFWKRFCAGIVDTIVLIPVVIIFFYLESISISGAMIVAFISSALYSAYCVYFHYRYGATLGKMVSKIKVTNLDGSSINLRKAILRSSVDIGFAVLMVTAQIIAISHATPEEYLSAGWMERVEYITPLYPSWFGLVTIGSNVWVWGEFFVLLLNKRKRAIHDFIADTVVIKREYAEQDAQLRDNALRTS
ncbi:RDD family protein [Marinomonas balearica]|uniref:Putative RDD family membrane protein YckC n=1 Tax=Marinomonas balearica TaxID=491947 RepID=A0A4V3CGT7_9GAMM|nr:RDD family protein [Marinomonas balearica]TDO98962.1 putative RDD family membrane protein YckC [Marinomonas balearica]